MKKLVMTVAVLACAASIVSAQTVTSANVVGYNKQMNQEGLQLFGMQFVGDATATVESVFGDSLPVESKVYTYMNDGLGLGGGVYGISTYTQPLFPPGASAAWSNPALPLNVGSGFWAELPTSSSAVEIIVSGEVLMTNTVVVTIDVGLQLLTNPYPYAMTVNQLGITPAVDDVVYTYANDGLGGGVYGISTYTQPLFPPGAPAAWSNPTLLIEVGAGFWYQTSAATTLTWLAPAGL